MRSRALPITRKSLESTEATEGSGLAPSEHGVFGNLVVTEKVAHSHRLVTVRAQPSRPKATAPSVAVVAALFAEIASFTGGAFVDGAWSEPTTGWSRRSSDPPSRPLGGSRSNRSVGVLGAGRAQATDAGRRSSRRSSLTGGVAGGSWRSKRRLVRKWQLPCLSLPLLFVVVHRAAGTAQDRDEPLVEGKLLLGDKFPAAVRGTGLAAAGRQIVLRTTP